ncbi:CobW family GTP-binding protein [Effusibacillus consociatus]|uniref:CobW family GTP-binding protein n=1 Tax=Effusibacillus consociatus TaxID=1117041 RepID=A0ABV9Q5L5_9BACL
MTKPIPVYILTGYLGAGKTTLLKPLLGYLKAAGRRPAVLMNEFGSVSVDTLLLQESEVPVVDLPNGCICCTLQGSLKDSLLRLIDGYGPDTVFLETTGVASPVDIVERLLEPELQDRIRLAGVFTMVSAAWFPFTTSSSSEMTVNERTMLEQVQQADVLLMSKTDLVSLENIDHLERVLRELNPKAPIFQVLNGNMDPSKLFEIETHQQKVRVEAKPKSFTRRKVGKVTSTVKQKPTSFGNLETLYYEFEAPVNPDKMYELLYHLPANVLRAKGFYIDAENGLLTEFHHVPSTPVSRAFVVGDFKPFAVMIYEGLDEKELKRKLKACEAVVPVGVKQK